MTAIRETGATPPRAQLLLAILLAWMLGACAASGETDGVRTERTDSAGLAVVTNHGSDRPLDWRFERVLDLGGDADGPAAFHRVHDTSIGTDAAGRLYVLDAGNYVVTVFDSAGNALRQMGRQGGGPGELRFPSDLGVGDDGSVAIWDYDAGGFVRFAPDGTVLPTVTVAAPLQRKLAVLEDRLLGAFAWSGAIAQDDESVTRLIAVAGADTVELVRAPEPEPALVELSCMRFAMPPFLSPGIVWAAHGDRVIARTTAEYSIAVYDAAGRQSAIWRRDLPLIPSTIPLAAAEVGSDSLRMLGGCAVSAEEAAERLGYATYAPHIQNLALARDGHVWVRRRTDQPNAFVIDILSSDGEYIGTLPAGSPFPAAFRGTDEIVTVERDSLDVPHVVVYRIVRPPT